MPSHEPIAVELDIESRADRAEWRELASRCPDATVFQDPDWVCAWHARLGGDTEPWLVGVRARGELVGLAPLGIRARGERREVVFLGGDVSDYFGLLAAPHARAAVARVVLEHLASAADRWDQALLGRLPPSSSLFGVALPASLSAETAEHDVCPYVPLPAEARTLAHVVPAGFAKRVAASLRAAYRAGPYEARWIAPDGARAFVETIFALHAARWRAVGQKGVLVGDALRGFWDEAVPALAARGLARMLEVRLRGEPIAALLAFARRGRVLHYLSGFDPRAGKLSPGRLALAALFERAIAEHAREVDFLRGVERYKYDWGARDRSTYALRITHAARG